MPEDLEIAATQLEILLMALLMITDVLSFSATAMRRISSCVAAISRSSGIRRTLRRKPVSYRSRPSSLRS